MVYLINEDTIFTLYNGDIEDLDFGTFLEYIFKKGFKFLVQYISVDSMLCVHKYVIYFCFKNRLICLTSTMEYSMVRGNPYNFYYDEYRFK